MIKIILSVFVTVFATGAFAQDSKMENSKMEMNKTSEAKMDDKKMTDQKMMDPKMMEGVMMLNNKAMMCNGSKSSTMSKSFQCTDGTTVGMDGKIMRKDGTSMMLMNGSMIDKSGKVSQIPHGEKGHVCSEQCHQKSKM